MFVFVFGACGSETTITILHFADLHDRLQPEQLVVGGRTNEVPGIARLIGTIKKEKALAPDSTLVLFAGDAIEGTTFSIIFKGEPIFKLFDGLVDYMVPGVHDFDYNLGNLLERTTNARYKMLAANTFDRDAKPFTGHDSVIHEIDGIKIGIFGISIPITANLQPAKNMGGLIFTPVEEAARKSIQRLRQQGADVIIALTHQGLEEDKKLARAVDDLGLDLIVGGLSHTNLHRGFQTFETKIVQAGFRGEHLGKVVIRYDRKKRSVVSITPTVIPITASSPKDEEAQKLVDEYDRKMQDEIDIAIGSTDVFLEGKREVVRRTETNLANFIADALRRESGAEMSLINAGLIRASISPGDISISDILTVLPYSNSLTVVNLPGRVIYRILEKSAACNPGEGRFLQVSSGVSYRIRGRALDELLFNGRELDPDRIYSVATTDFLANGGDNYPEFSHDPSPRFTGITISESVIAAIRSMGKINPRVEGRIVRLEDD
jgi:2',3'-cyclic-nucleotide 2'-phosphodiesterase (5'-nucleotidase family)